MLAFVLFVVVAVLIGVCVAMEKKRKHEERYRYFRKHALAYKKVGGAGISNDSIMYPYMTNQLRREDTMGQLFTLTNDTLINTEGSSSGAEYARHIASPTGFNISLVDVHKDDLEVTGSLKSTKNPYHHGYRHNKNNKKSSPVYATNIPLPNNKCSVNIIEPPTHGALDCVSLNTDMLDFTDDSFDSSTVYANIAKAGY